MEVDNQGFKEEIFIQTDRTGGDRELERRGHSVAAAVAVVAAVGSGMGVAHSCVADKNWEGHLGSKRSQPQARPRSPGFQF